MTKLILMRHGNTFEEGQIPVQVGAKTDLSLTSFGISQAKKVAEFLKASPPDKIFSGPLKRHKESAEIIAKELEMDFEISEALNEIDYGLWEGLTSEEIAHKWPKEYAEWNNHSKWQNHLFEGSKEMHLERLKKWFDALRQLEVVFAVTSNGLLRFFKNEKVKTGHLSEFYLTGNSGKNTISDHP